MLILTFIGVYLVIGGVFAAAFFVRGYAAIAPGARASIGARVLWLPAAVALWPHLTVKWLRAHRQAATAATAAAAAAAP